jgi:2-isopropylmalate synthase
MDARQVAVFDTTLRDGEQSPGCSMTPAEKLRLARQLERLGVDVIEAGFPASSRAEFEAVRAVALALRGCGVAALSRARPSDVEITSRALEGAARPRIHVFLATSALHLACKLRLSQGQALEQAVHAVRLARAACNEVEFSPEDASRTDYGYLREVVQATTEAGASVINIPDTVGYALPHEYGALIARLRRDVPGPVLSVHCHNDLGLAAANSLAGVQAGARQVEVTVNGIGERAGNTSLEEFAMALRVRSSSLGFRTGIRGHEIGGTSRLLSNITGVWPQPNKAVVGRNAFAHEAGIHQHGVLVNPLTYEIMTPASVGAGQTLLVLGKHSGRHAVEARLRALGVHVPSDEIEALTARVKTLAERKKFIYDDDLLHLASCKPDGGLRLVRYHAMTGSEVISTATVEIEDAGGARRRASAVGNGPLDAALKAVDAALECTTELLEFTTRAVSRGTDALAEVSVRVRRGDVEAAGQAGSTDSVEATLKAYLSAIAATRRAHAQARAFAQPDAGVPA